MICMRVWTDMIGYTLIESVVARCGAEVSRTEGARMCHCMLGIWENDRSEKKKDR